MNSDHINMFAKAKEIQEGWALEVRDRYVFRHKHYHDHIFFYGSDSTIPPEELKLIAIFLPSIEQMAEMWGEVKKVYPSIFLIELGHWLVEGSANVRAYGPLNIIVLAFIQHELFSMMWDAEKEDWVKICQ